MSKKGCFDESGFSRIRKWQQWLTDSGLLPFSQVLMLKSGEEVFYNDCGYIDAEEKKKISRESVSRMYSMTKPISSLGLMLLFEEGKFQLSDPVRLYLGDNWKKKNMKVYNHDNQSADTKYLPCTKSITIEMLLTHTSGISYGFDFLGQQNEVDRIYYDEGLLQNATKTRGIVTHHENLESFVTKLSEMPLMFQPGDHFNYGYSVEVVGRLIEVLSGQCFGEFITERILKPLRMINTGFYFQDVHHESDNVTSLYRHQFNPIARGLTRDKLKLKKLPASSRQWTKNQTFFKPGEGLVSTIDDYAKFAHMLRNGGELNGTRIVSRKTLEYMVTNHLRDKNYKPSTTAEMRHPLSFEDIARGRGFGLGFAVDLDPVSLKINTSPGTFYWSGAASTHFWVDPVEDIVVVFITQVLFVEAKLLPLRNMLVNIVNSSIANERVSVDRILCNSQHLSKL